MASRVFNSPEPLPQERSWAARLIPGAAAWQAGGRRRTMAKRSEASAEWARGIFTLLLPGPLERRGAAYWVRSMVTDYLLVTLNWFLVCEMAARISGAQGGVPGFALRAPGFSRMLLGIALVHGALITLLSYTEGVTAQEADWQYQARRLGKAVFWATLVLSAALQLEGSPPLTAVPVWGAGLLHFATLVSWRWCEAKRGQRLESPKSSTRNVLIVGASESGRRIARHLEEHPERNRAVYGFLDDRKPLGNGVIGRMHDLATLARTGFVDEVILTGQQDRETTSQILFEAEQLRLDVKIVPDLFGHEPPQEIERIGDVAVIALHEERLPVHGLWVKRVLDVLVAGCALLALAPVLGLIALLIKIESRGPVIYKASRAGRKGRLFRCYKFRTMVKDADDQKDKLRERNQRQGPIFKIADDPRITRVGRRLRRYSLDELPQFWNVLKGDMSLVGPRPHPLDDYSAYSIEHLPRLDVTPGITGLWQVTARRDPSFQRGMDLDLDYIRRWSLSMDLRILLKTAMVVMRGSGD